MSLSTLSIKRPVFTIVINLLIILFGILGYSYLGVREFPSIDPAQINVRTNYTGANAEIIESQITEPLEKAINSIDGILNITSSSNQGSSNITIEFKLEKNLEEIRIRGLARATGSVTPGINGFSAPVFDHQGMMVAAITSLGALGNFDTEWDNRIATAVKKAASHLSKQLGYHNLLTRL